MKVRWLHLWLWPGTVPTMVSSGPGPLTVLQEVLDGTKTAEPTGCKQPRDTAAAGEHQQVTETEASALGERV